MPIKNLSDIEKLLNLSEGSLSEAQSSEEEVEISIPELYVSTKENHETLISNIKNESGKGVMEVAIKKKYDERGWERPEGGKNLDALLDTAMNKAVADAKIEPDKKVKSITDDFNAIKSKYDEALQSIESLKAEGKRKDDQSFIYSKVMDQLPGEDKLKIPKRDVYDIFMNRNKVSRSESNDLIFTKGDEIIKDELRNPVTLDKMLTDFLPTYLKEPSGGNGGKDSKSTKPENSVEAVEERLRAEGKSDSEIMQTITKMVTNKELS